MAKRNKQKFTWVRFTADYARWTVGTVAELADWYADMLVQRGVAVVQTV
jgi:hypothetical protein